MKVELGLLYSPVIHTLAGLVLGIAGMSMVSSEATATAVFAVTMAYAIASPILIALRRWWFVNAILSAVGMFILLTIMPVLGLMVGEHESVRATGLLQVMPAMVFPCALVLSGVLRLLVVRKERGAAQQKAA